MVDEFLTWRDRTLGIAPTLHPNIDLDTRKRWLWAFSMQLVYGLRIHEVFAIKNLNERVGLQEKTAMIGFYKSGTDGARTRDLLRDRQAF